jgi:medium-chain acyl-[acyl-carrier-protein] hydrolase
MTPTLASPWIVRPRPRPEARLRLYCFPYAGGGASVYHAWGARLPEAIEVCAIQMPGHETRMREPMATSMEALVTSLAAALAPALDRPFAFFGHSLGGRVAFETARALRRLHAPSPVALIAGACTAPQLRPSAPPLHALPDEAFLDGIAARYGGIPDAVRREPELMALVLPVLRADCRLVETYVCEPEPPLVGAIAAYGGEDDASAPPADLAAWADQTTGRFRHATLPGDHFFLVRSQEALLRNVAALLLEE